MRIALDYDGTFNANREFWVGFISLASLYGYEVMIVTMRGEQDWHDDFRILKNMGIPVHFCDSFPKRKVMEDKGIKIDWWIDDWPEGISQGSQFTEEEVAKWRIEARETGEIMEKK